MESRNVKFVIDQLINDNINVGEHLNNVKCLVELKFGKALSDLDSIYVEDRYVELLLTKWLQEAPEQAVRFILPTQIIDFTKRLGAVRNFRDCSSFCQASRFFGLILNVYDESPTLKAQEAKSILQFKQECLFCLQLCIGNFQEYDLNLINELANVLKRTVNLDKICTLLKLREFISDSITFKYFITNLLKVESTDNHIAKLQKAGEQLSEQGEFSFLNNLKEMIGTFLEPIVIQPVIADGRSVLEVAGAHIVLREILPKLESEMNLTHVDEIRFVKALVLHVNVSLNNAVWKGKNLVISAETLIVNDKGAVWDVSGADGDEAPSIGADHIRGGKKGADGNPGESGGNVLVAVEAIEGGNLEIISIGGNGGKGLEGIKGADGEDGRYIDGLEFKSMFPPVSVLFDSDKLKYLKTTKDSIFQNLKSVKILYFKETKFENMKPCSILELKSSEDLNDFYINGKTEDECEITFSFYSGGYFGSCQSYLLHRGAPGGQGESGREGGKGGCAGLAGDIEVHIGSASSSGKVKLVQNNGEPGADGDRGPDGIPGNSGGDCGYVDKTLSTEFPKTHVVHPKDESRLTLEYSDSSSSNSVYCSFKKQCCEIKTKEKPLIQRSKQYKKNNQQQQSVEKPVHVQAKRKKTIHLKSMIAQYKTNMFSTVDKCYDSLEIMKGIIEEMLVSDLQIVQETTNCKIAWQVKYVCNSGLNEKILLEDDNFDELDIKPEVDRVYGYGDSNYKLKGLKMIQDQYFTNNSYKNENTLSFKFESNVHNKIFSTKLPQEFVETYFLNSQESRLEVQSLFYKSDVNELKHAIIIFIKTFGHKKPKATMYLKRYNCLKNKSTNLLIPIINLFSRAEYQQLFRKLCESISRVDSGLLVNILSDIGKDTFLNKLYKHYQVKNTYDWTGPIIEKGEKDLREEMSEEIMNQGPLADFYREFLSYNFNKNILYYTVDECGNYVLQSDHNPSSENKIYVLLKDGMFYELDVNLNIVGLQDYLKKMGCLYSKILLTIESLTQKEKIDKFTTISPFKRNDFESVDRKTSSYIKTLQIMSENRNIKIIQNIFDSDENVLIAPRLDKMKYNYIGSTNILHYMALHLEHDGKCISAQEFCFVLNFILRSSLTMPISVASISWIIASCSPKNWLIEITVLKLEMYLGRVVKSAQKDRWRKFLSNKNEKSMLMAFFVKISEDSSCADSVEDIDEVLLLMSSIPKAHVGLEQVDLKDWKYYLKDKYWLHKLKNNLSWPEDDLKLASLYFVLLNNLQGFEGTSKFFNLVTKHLCEEELGFDRNLLLDILRDLLNNDICLDGRFIETLSNVTIYDWRSKIEDMCFVSGSERSLRQVLELTQKCGNTSKYIINRLQTVERVIENAMIIEQMCTKDLKEYQLKDWIDCLIILVNGITTKSGHKHIDKKLSELIISFGNIMDTSQMLSCNEIIAKIKEELVFAAIIIGIKNLYDINLRNTQKLSIMTFLKSGRNVLAQISTGEGKSLIIVCVAIVKAIGGQKVDIITSSTVLAERDAKEYDKLYKLFGLSVGHNCSERLEERKKVYSTCHIVYGELASFQRDFLLDRMYNQNILGDRSFEIVLVDEVDSLLLDRGNNTLYLSHEIPGLDKLEPLFVYIWKWLNTRTVQDVVELKEDILITLGQINNKCLRELDSKLTENEIYKILKVFVNEGITSQNGIILKGNIDYDKLDSKTKSFIDIDHLKYMFNKMKNCENQFVIPNYLKDFVYRHLDGWIDSAQMAMGMESGTQYIVDIDRSDTSFDRSPNITILDGDTGTDQTNCQWENGLHQFLQLKHGCKHFSISLKAVFISNVSFIKKYKQLCGLSGTLGTTIERTLLENVYNVDYVTIPTAKARHFIEIPSTTCKYQRDWIKQIINSVYEISTTRSSLIICESVNDVVTLKNYFYNFLQGKNAPHIKLHTYTRDYEQLAIANNLEQHQIIISTNLAGRGTDIKLSKDLITAGGLHVCLSFLPKNSRVEEQAFGRVARNGQPGTAQIIFISACENSISKIVDLKKQRNRDEIHRIANVKHDYKSKIISEEKHLEQFQERFLQLKKEMKQPENVKSLLLQVCLDKWAYWLDEHVDDITSASNDDLLKDISKVLKWDSEYDPVCIKDPFQLTKLGFIFLERKDYEISNKLFNRVIKEEEDFSEVALYYRIHAKAGKNDLDSSSISNVLDDFTLVESMLKKRIASSLMSGRFIDWLKSHNAKSITQIDSFKEQQLQRCNIFNMFLKSIDDITGHEVLPGNLSSTLASCGQVFNNEFSAFRIYGKCVEEKVITLPELKPFREIDLTFAFQYGIHPKELNKILVGNKKEIVNLFWKNNYLKINNDNGFMKRLKQLLPSRELFWKTLLHNKLLVDEKKYLFVDYYKLEQEMPDLSIIINNLKSDIPSTATSTIWLYKKDELKITRNDCFWVVFEKSKVMSVVGDDIYRYLKRQGIIHCNKLATLSHSPYWEKPFMFVHFDLLTVSDIIKLGISDKVARSIIAELVEKNVIKKVGKNRSAFSLTTDEEEIKKIQLAQYPAYTSDVKMLLTHHFSFRIAYQKLLYLKSRFGLDGDKLCLPLQPHLYKSFFRQLQEILLTQPKVNIKFGEKLNATKYPQSMNAENWEKIFSQFFNESIAKDIICSLIKCQWLLVCILSTKYIYYVNHKAVSDKEEKIYGLIQPLQLPGHLEVYKRLIEFVLIEYLNLSMHDTGLKKCLESCLGEMYSKDTLSFDFKPLLTILKENNLPSSECSTFSLNGFDQLMVAHEKPYSFKMLIKVFLINMLGIAEIAAGVALMASLGGLVIGNGLLSEGIGDIIYSISCLLTGHCSTSDYIVNKSISLCLSAVSSGYRLLRLYKSTYGLKTGGWTMKSILNNMKGLFIRETESTGVANVVVKRIVKAAGVAVGVGVKNTVVQQAIAPQIEKLGVCLTGMIHSNMEKTIVEHAVVESVKNTFKRFGKHKATEMINLCFQNTIEKNKYKSKNSLQGVSTVCQTLLNHTFKELTSNSETGEFDLGCAFKIAELMVNFSKLISNCTNCWTQIKHVVDDTLKGFQEDLEQMNDYNQNHPATNINHDEETSNYLISVFVEKWKNDINKLLFNNINEVILCPLLQYTTNTLSSRFIELKFQNNSFFSDKEIQEILKSKPAYQEDVKSQEVKFSNKCFFESEYNKLLLSLLQTNNHASVFIEISNRNIPLDMNCIQICCEVLPNLLKKKGIPVPPFEVVLDTDGEQKRYKTHADGSDFKTIYLSQNESILYNVSQNCDLCISTVFNIIGKSILPPECVPIMSQLLSEVLSKINPNDVLPSSGETAGLKINKPSTSYSAHINTAPEEVLIRQHNSWMFQPSVDIDLRTEQLSHSGAVQDCILQGFGCALEKINQYISTLLLGTNCSLKLDLQDFSESDHEIWPNSNHSGGFPFCCLPACYELVMPLPLASDDTFWEFLVKMRLITHVDKRAETARPGGAHIRYEVSPLVSTSHWEKSIRGHVLLSEECQRVTHTIDQCHVAGELIVPTGFTLPLLTNRCDVLIIADIPFRNGIGEHIVKHGQFQSKHVNYEKNKLFEIKDEIINTCKLYRGVRCTVLYFGSIDLSDNEELIAANIKEIVHDLRSNLEKDNIVLCSVKHKKSIINSELIIKREKINKHLSSFCGDKRLSYINLNTHDISSSKIIETVGIHIVKEINIMLSNSHP